MEGTAGAEHGTALETVIIFTAHMERLAGFYQEALGIGPFECSPGHMGCKVGAVYLGFDQVEWVEPGPGGGGDALVHRG